jgi:uncharacterized protein involved in cysteine biosynthesis
MRNIVLIPSKLGTIIIPLLIIVNLPVHAENIVSGELPKKIDTADLSGINLWIINLYNDDRILFAIVVTMLMIILGIAMAALTDFILSRFGIKTSKLKHIEY